MGGGEQRGETEAERAMAQVAVEKLRDYKLRWAPLIERTAETVKGMAPGDPNSTERVSARGRAATETTAQFGRAGDRAEAGMENRGVGASSSAFRLGKVNLGTDEAKSRGLAVAGSEQAVDQAYVEGLTDLMNLGHGKESAASGGLERSAALAARQAEADADASAANRAGNARLVGTGAGMGFGLYRRDQTSPMGQPNAGPQAGWGNQGIVGLG